LGPFEEEDVPVDIGSTVPSDLKDEFDIECSDTVQKPARPPTNSMSGRKIHRVNTRTSVTDEKVFVSELQREAPALLGASVPGAKYVAARHEETPPEQLTSVLGEERPESRAEASTTELRETGTAERI
jgi:hypothetical protein